MLAYEYRSNGVESYERERERGLCAVYAAGTGVSETASAAEL